MGQDQVFIGVELQYAWRLYTLAALDANLKLLALHQGRLSEVVAYLAENHPVLAAICAPLKPNRGRMQREEIRAGLFSALPGNHSAEMRQVEYELLSRGLPAPRTPPVGNFTPAWMRRGQKLVQELTNLGYAQFSEAETRNQLIETCPEAIFTSLLGHTPFPADALEGRIQRQLVLWDNRLPVRDPMTFFEEVTRHKLLRGILPDQAILPIARLNALAAAHAAYLAAIHPERVTRYGEPEEGEIVLPAFWKPEAIE